MSGMDCRRANINRAGVILARAVAAKMKCYSLMKTHLKVEIVGPGDQTMSRGREEKA